MLTPTSVRTPEFLAALTALDVDAAAVVGYGKLLPQPVLDAPKHGWVNLHFSLLPAWRGAAPVQAAIRAGDEITGATTFRLEAGMDTGPVYGVVTETVRPDDTAGELLGRLADSGARLLVATLDGIADGSLHPRPQPAEGVSLAAQDHPRDPPGSTGPHPLSRSTGRSARSPPTPGRGPTRRGDGWCSAPSSRRRWPAWPPANSGSSGAGCWSAPAPPRWNCGDLTAPGKRAMPAADWARGARPDAGRRPGPIATADDPPTAASAGAVRAGRPAGPAPGGRRRSTRPGRPRSTC